MYTHVHKQLQDALGNLTEISNPLQGVEPPVLARATRRMKIGMYLLIVTYAFVRA